MRPGSDIDMAVRGLPPSVYFSAISKVTGPPRQTKSTSWIWTMPHRLFDIFSAAGIWSVARELIAKIRVGLEELAIVRQQFEALISVPSDATVGVIETSAASAMLHSF